MPEQATESRARRGGKGGGKARPASREHRAAKAATAKNSLRVDLPVLGAVRLPPPDQLAFLGGVALLATLGVIEWPVGIAVAAGHLLSSLSGHKVVHDFAEALEDA